MPRRAPVLSHRTKTAPLEGRVPPSNPEAEQSVLGGILLEPGSLDRIADILTPEDFYHEAHEKIYTDHVGPLQAPGTRGSGDRDGIDV